MTYADAKTILAAPLRFGDEEQVKAVRVMEVVSEFIAAGGDPKNARTPCDECNGYQGH